MCLCHDTTKPACGAYLDESTLPKSYGSYQVKGAEIYHGNQMLDHKTKILFLACCAIMEFHHVTCLQSDRKLPDFLPVEETVPSHRTQILKGQR